MLEYIKALNIIQLWIFIIILNIIFIMFDVLIRLICNAWILSGVIIDKLLQGIRGEKR